MRPVKKGEESTVDFLFYWRSKCSLSQLAAFACAHTYISCLWHKLHQSEISIAAHLRIHRWGFAFFFILHRGVDWSLPAPAITDFKLHFAESDIKQSGWLGWVKSSVFSVKLLYSSMWVDSQHVPHAAVTWTSQTMCALLLYLCDFFFLCV